MARLSENEKRDRKIAREIAASARLAEKLEYRLERKRAHEKKWKANNRARINAAYRERFASDAEFRARRAERLRKWRARKRAEMLEAERAPERAKKKAWRRANAERELPRHREESRRFRANNPESVKASQRKWKEKQDPALFREYNAKRYALHADKIKARRMAYYYANREKINAKRRVKRAGV